MQRACAVQHPAERGQVCLLAEQMPRYVAIRLVVFHETAQRVREIALARLPALAHDARADTRPRRLEDAFLGSEAPLHRWHAHASSLGDSRKRHTIERQLAEELFRRVEDALLILRDLPRAEPLRVGARLFHVHYVNTNIDTTATARRYGAQTGYRPEVGRRGFHRLPWPRTMTTRWSEIQLGGVEQWVSVRGEDPTAPVLLYLHGGPGASEYGPRRRFLRCLERSWRVVDWDQRGAGRSFRGDEDATVLTLDRLVLDGVELLEWICRELSVARVVVAGHSFGSVLGLRMSQVAPTRVAAFVGAGQVVHWAEQERVGYDWALAEAHRRGKARVVAALERLGPPADGMYGEGVPGVEVQRRCLVELGGVAGTHTFLARYVMSTVTCADYPWTAKIRHVASMRRSMECMWADLGRRVDLFRDATRLDVPVHLFAGARDRITPLSLVERWYAVLKAPVKRLEVVGEACHLVNFEAPQQFDAWLHAVRAVV
jgi:pimeloyl-ACP methyl ester carboxylesterase